MLGVLWESRLKRRKTAAQPLLGESEKSKRNSPKGTKVSIRPASGSKQAYGGAVLEELQPGGRPRRISSGRMVSHGRNPMWIRSREQPWRSGRDKAASILYSHDLLVGRRKKN